jgi:quercetin dioxygenase-like cupin family protein
LKTCGGRGIIILSQKQEPKRKRRYRMIRQKEDVQIRKVSNAQGGKGDVFFHDWLLPDEAPGHGRVFSKLVIPPGCSIAPHQHKGEFEAIYVLEGTATVTDGDQVVEIAEGGMNLCREGDTHGVENKTEKDLVLIALIMKNL